ncbi:MAG: CPBP family intramembrane glutamic endopeptidase [Thermaerobacterales bacterium]
MSENMNRQYRREMKRDEKRRQKRMEEVSERRRRKRQARMPNRAARSDRPAPGAADTAAPRPPVLTRFKGWLLRPYKSLDMMLLFLALLGLRYIALAMVGGEEQALADPQLWYDSLFFSQIIFGLVIIGYLRYVAREGPEWLGPPANPMPAARVVLTGAGLGAAIWVGTYTLTLAMLWLSGAPDTAIAGILTGAPWPGLVTAAVLVLVKPITDELFYRRTLMRIFFRTGLSPRMAIFFTTFLFAIGQGTLDAVAAGVLAGAALTVAYARTQATLMVVTAHMVWGTLRLLLG